MGRARKSNRLRRPNRQKYGPLENPFPGNFLPAPSFLIEDASDRGTLVKDLKYAFRMLIAQPGFTAVAVLSLALGIGLNTTIFSVVNAVLLRPEPVERPDQLVEVYSRVPNRLRSWRSLIWPVSASRSAPL